MNQIRDVKIISVRLREPAELAEYLTTIFANVIAADFVELSTSSSLEPIAIVEALIGDKRKPPAIIQEYQKMVQSLVNNLLHKEFRRRVAGRSQLRFVELSRALACFTDTCHPETLWVRQCLCKSWVTEGEGICGFCGDPEPLGRPTRAWKIGPTRFSQLAPQHMKLSGSPVTSSEADADDMEDRDWQEPEFDEGAVYD